MEKENKKRFAKLEEMLRVMQGYEDQIIKELSRYAWMKFPKKFKIPEFTKYDGIGDTKAHLKYQLIRMGNCVKNVPLLI